MIFEKRIKNIFRNLKQKPDAIIIINSSEPYIDVNFFYVTGLEKGLFENSVAVLHPTGKVDIIISELESESAKKSNAKLNVYKNGEEFDELFKNTLSSLKNIGLNFSGMSHRDFCKIKNSCPNSEFEDVSEAFAKARLIKDEFEIKTIKKACNISDRVMKMIPDILHKGIHEFEIAAEINYLMQKNGADDNAFETISSFGKNTAEPHYSHGNYRLKNGDFALFDFGARFRRYNSDMTRTFVFGKASKEQKDMHKTVLEAQRNGFNAIHAGIKAHKVHDVVSTYIDNTRFKGRFIHSTGHPFGLGVHDAGAGFNSECKVELKENMVLTVEPGIYKPGYGGVRIEDDILVKKDGVELLTKTSRELIEI